MVLSDGSRKLEGLLGLGDTAVESINGRTWPNYHCKVDNEQYHDTIKKHDYRKLILMNHDPLSAGIQHLILDILKPLVWRRAFPLFLRRAVVKGVGLGLILVRHGSVQ